MEKIKCSSASVKRFIKLILETGETPYWIHQTLTFKDQKIDKNLSKLYLKKLLDSLGQIFPNMSSIFIEEYQKNLRLHFHVIFIFFGKQPYPPERMREVLGHEVFMRWNKLNGGDLVRQANRITLQKKDERTIDYLTKGLLPTGKKAGRDRLWHGVRNKKLLKENSSPISNGQVNHVFHKLFGRMRKRGRPREPLPKYFSERDLKREKEYASAYWETTGKAMDWESFKRIKLNTTEKVSDRDYMNFRNEKFNRIYKKRFQERYPKTDNDPWF